VGLPSKQQVATSFLPYGMLPFAVTTDHKHGTTSTRQRYNTQVTTRLVVSTLTGWGIAAQRAGLTIKDGLGMT